MWPYSAVDYKLLQLKPTPLTRGLLSHVTHSGKGTLQGVCLNLMKASGRAEVAVLLVLKCIKCVKYKWQHERRMRPHKLRDVILFGRRTATVMQSASKTKWSSSADALATLG